MNADSRSYADRVADLDEFANIATDALEHAVSWQGTCMWLRSVGDEPAWTQDERSDRELVAAVCAACPVQRECLELEFRQTGYATVSIWGPLAADERREAFMEWAERRCASDGGELA